MRSSVAVSKLSTIHSRRSLFKGTAFATVLGTVITSCAVGQSVAVASQGDAQAPVQGATYAIVNPVDNSVFTLDPTATLGQKDAPALTEVTAYSSALGGGKRWVGMQATGTITYANDATQHSATLTNLGPHSFRLDVQTPKGPVSIRIQGRMGAVQTGTEAAIPLDPDSATTGIFPFEIVGMAVPEAKTTALLDRGTVNSSGSSLHRVTLELSSTNWNPGTKSQGTLPIDLYFDPATHLLVKSACNIFSARGRHVPLLSVVTYSDYRTVGTAVVPFQYSESIDGHPYQTMQLTSVQLNPALPADYFQFERPKQ